MTELGLAFNDDDLDTHKKKHNKDRDLPYHVKIVAPRWFDQAVEQFDCPGQEPQVFKFSGDYKYRLRDYAGAAQQYKSALDILPENNVAVSQDLRESLARCYAFLGNHGEALQVSKDLVKEMPVEDEARQRQSLMLLAFVCEKACLWEECVQTLQRLCLLQPNFPQTWCQLGDAMAKLTRLPETREKLQPVTDNSKSTVHTSPEIIISSQSEISRDKDSETQLLVIMMCYTRAKMLFESVMRNASDIIKVRNQQIVAEIAEKINNLPLSEELKQRLPEVGSMEDHVELQNIAFQHGSILDLFYQRFFKLHKNIHS